MHPLLFQSKIIKHTFTICFPDLPQAGSQAAVVSVHQAGAFGHSLRL